MTRTPLAARTAGVLLAATALLAGGAVPAAAAPVGGQEVVGATAATALSLTLNLPGGATTRVLLQLDPVTGTVTRTTSQTAATAVATVLRGSLGGEALDSGSSSASLPSPLESSSDPGSAVADGLAGTPLADLLTVELLPSSATVSRAPSSTSEAAVAGLGVGLPDALASALAPLTTPLRDAVGDLLASLAAASGTPVDEICTGATDAVTALDPGDVDDVLATLEVPIAVAGLLDDPTLAALCGLSTTIDGLDAALQDALSSLTGARGVLGTGLVRSAQRITRAGSRTTAVAEAQVAGLTLLGQRPFASGEALRTTSTASVAGTPGSARATVESTVEALTGGTVDPFAEARATVDTVVGSIDQSALPPELASMLTDLLATLDAALAPVGVTVVALDASADATALERCPTALDSTLTGTLAAADGRCAAAATRGVGLQLDLPAALDGPLMITGPLVELAIVPAAAVVKAQPVAAAVQGAPAPAPATLPRTGLDSATLAGTGLVLLAGAAVVRRRRVPQA